MSDKKKKTEVYFTYVYTIIREFYSIRRFQNIESTYEGYSCFDPLENERTPFTDPPGSPEGAAEVSSDLEEFGFRDRGFTVSQEDRG